MNVLIIGDEIARLNRVSDTSLNLAQTLTSKKHEVFWAIPSQLRLNGNKLVVNCHALSFKGENLGTGETVEKYLQSFDWVLVRKDPPFDNKYLEMCWLLAPYEKQINFLNKPSLLLRYHEKMIPLECHNEGIFSSDEILPMTLVRSFKELEIEIQKTKSSEWVLKPFLGHGGEEIHSFEIKNLNSVAHLLTGMNWILQPLEASIRSDGDYRALFIKGEFVGGFLRKPAANSIVSNLAQGGTALDRELSSKELLVLSRLGLWLKDKEFFLAGADLIGGKLSEVNVTSPTGFKTVLNMKKISLADKCMSEMEKMK